MHRRLIAAACSVILVTVGVGVAYADFALNFEEIRTSFTTDPGTTITMLSQGSRLWLPEVDDEVVCLQRPAGKEVFLEWRIETNLLLPAVQRQRAASRDIRMRGRMQLGFRVEKYGSFTPIYRGPVRGRCVGAETGKTCDLELTAMLRDGATKNRAVVTVEAQPIVFPSIGDILEFTKADVTGVGFCKATIKK